MIKGYIFRNKDGYWELGFLSELGVEGEALYTTYKNDYHTWDDALAALIQKHIKEQ